MALTMTLRRHGGQRYRSSMDEVWSVKSEGRNCAVVNLGFDRHAFRRVWVLHEINEVPSSLFLF